MKGPEEAAAGSCMSVGCACSQHWKNIFLAVVMIVGFLALEAQIENLEEKLFQLEIERMGREASGVWRIK